MLAGPLHEFAGDLLGVAEVDLGAGRSGRPEGEAGELQLGRGLAGALADQVHGGVAHRLVRLLLEHLQAVRNGRHRIDHIVTDTARNQRRKFKIAECRRIGHGASSFAYAA